MSNFLVGETLKEGAPASPAFNPVGRSCIPYPSHLSEQEVQTKLYTLLQKNGLDARCQVWSHDHKCLFDIVVFRKKLPILIIEVKRKGSLLLGRKGEQMYKYRQYGVKVISCQGEDEINQAVRSAIGKLAAINRDEIALKGRGG
jgi:hypothetical protein